MPGVIQSWYSVWQEDVRIFKNNYKQELVGKTIGEVVLVLCSKEAIDQDYACHILGCTKNELQLMLTGFEVEK